MMHLSLVILFVLSCETTSFSLPSQQHRPAAQNEIRQGNSELSRRKFVSGTTAAIALLKAGTATKASADLPPPGEVTTIKNAEEGVTLYKTPSGLKYIELKEGTGPSPNYGQLVTIAYTAYMKIPNKKKQKFDSNKILLKHGNGRMVAGLDEGLHTMKLGGVRRLIIPPKLGFVDSGLGPLPSSFWNRNKLNDLLDQMVAAKAGDLIYDVELKLVLDDEADQGYYQDESLTPEEFNTLRNNLQEKAAKAAAERMAAGDSGEGELNLPAAPTV